MIRRSLFVVSLPRSLSSVIYGAACHSLQLAAPAWTSDGEVLNADRISRRHPSPPPAQRFSLPHAHPEAFDRLTEFLGHATAPAGFAYKDVVQPFAVAGWEGIREFNVLAIRRDVAEVTYAMLKRRWRYPSEAALLNREAPWSVIEGLLRAEAAIAATGAEVVEYADAIRSHATLETALARLYPDADLRPLRYIGRPFERRRRRLEAERRYSHVFARIEYAVEVVREQLSDSNGESPTRRPRRMPASAR